jgi:hypothetical protein
METLSENLGALCEEPGNEKWEVDYSVCPPVPCSLILFFFLFSSLSSLISSLLALLVFSTSCIRQWLISIVRRINPINTPKWHIRLK